MGSMFDYYNLIEKCLLEVPLSDREKREEGEYDVQNKIIKEIKGLAMCLSRFKPADWNKFLDVVIKWESWEQLDCFVCTNVEVLMSSIEHMIMIYVFWMQT